MTIRPYIILFFSILSFQLIGQVWCDMDDRLSIAMQNKAFEYTLETIRQSSSNLSIQNRSEQWLPVVVHVVGYEGYQPITEAQVIHQIDVLNNDFAGKGENISKLSDEFENLVTDTGLRFCLAKTDPKGNPTSGITYTTTTVPDIGIKKADFNRGFVHYDKLGGKSGWDPARYINIWVCEYGSSILGSATFPGMSPFPEESGIVLDIRYFGSLGDASRVSHFGRGHTLTHEMGHFFGLFHIWGHDEASCSDSDEVEDTPNASGPWFGCPSGVQSSCSTSNMYQNFMDLTDDRCLAAFTHGQAMRMQGTIEAFYPSLMLEEPCHVIIEPFDKWWDDLVWAYDAYSKQYIFYTSEGFSGNVTMEVFSTDGRLVTRDTWSGQQSYLLELNTAAVGIYFVRITNGDTWKVRKISVY